MIVVIQCAAKKQDDAGLLRTRTGVPVLFVAKPSIAPPSKEYVYAHPDDLDEDGISWRKRLLLYNESQVNEPGLKQAAHLYYNSTYRELVHSAGVNRTFILSAGWGLIRADFLTPRYDITFSANAAQYARRGKTDRYNDFRMLPSDSQEAVLFFGGKDYVRLFLSLTARVQAARIVIHNSSMQEDHIGRSLLRLETSTRTNWHYEAVRAYIAGKLRFAL